MLQVFLAGLQGLQTLQTLIPILHLVPVAVEGHVWGLDIVGTKVRGWHCSRSRSPAHRVGKPTCSKMHLRLRRAMLLAWSYLHLALLQVCMWASQDGNDRWILHQVVGYCMERRWVGRGACIGASPAATAASAMQPWWH